MGLFSRKKKGDKIASEVDALVKKSDSAIGKATKVEHVHQVVLNLAEKTTELVGMQLDILKKLSRFDEIKGELLSIRAQARRLGVERSKGRLRARRRVLVIEAIELRKELRGLKEQNITLEHLEAQTEKIEEMSRRATDKTTALFGELTRGMDGLIEELAGKGLGL